MLHLQTIFRAHRGQSITELVILLVLVTVTCITALSSFSDNLLLAMGGMHTRMKGTGAVADPGGGLPLPGTLPPTDPAPDPGVDPTPGVTPPMVTDPNAYSVAVTLASGKQINLSGYPKSVAQTVETSGANGATMELANFLAAFAEQLEASGEITPEDKNLLMALANQGHEIAYIENLLEEMAATHDDQNGYMELTVDYHGTPMTVQELTDMIGFYNSHMDNTDPLSPVGAYPELEKFLNLYVQVDSAGALGDPVVRQIVESLVGEIALLSDDVESLSAAYMEDLLPSQVTNRDSASICTIGNGQDAGVQCQ
ncbi:MAG: hypothetical protein AB7P76_00685 [Candidatus Melainabacteria bacterium]